MITMTQLAKGAPPTKCEIIFYPQAPFLVSKEGGLITDYILF